MKKLIFVIFFVFISILINACTYFGDFKQPSTANDTFQLTTYFAVEETDIGYEYHPSEGMLIKKTNKEQNNMSLEGKYYWTYASTLSLTERFALVVLYDYVQVPILVDGKNFLTYVFSVKSIDGKINDPAQIEDVSQASYITLGINLPDDEDCHVLSFLLFTHIDNGEWHEGNNRTRYMYSTNVSTIGIRGNNNFCTNNSIEYPSDYSKSINKEYPFAGTSQLSRSKTDTRQLFENNIPVAKDQPAYLHVANIEDYSVPFIVLKFLNWEQIPFSNDTKILYGTIKPSEDNSYYSPIPDQAGIYTMVLVTFPFNRGFDDDNSQWINFTEGIRFSIEE
jgi:hypothetical protein